MSDSTNVSCYMDNTPERQKESLDRDTLLSILLNKSKELECLQQQQKQRENQYTEMAQGYQDLLRDRQTFI